MKKPFQQRQQLSLAIRNKSLTHTALLTAFITQMFLNSVIPAKAGIHWLLNFRSILKWIPACAGMTVLNVFFKRTKQLLFLLSLLVASQLAYAELVAIPPLTALVTDLTGTLNASQISQLDAKLKAFEAKKGSQIAVLIVPSVQSEDIAQYSIRVTDAWKLGREKQDDGVLILIAKDDHKMRIEVGYGLEGPIPDLTAKRVISEFISPKFKQGDFYGGLDAGLDKLIGLVDGEALPAPSSNASNGLAIESMLPILLFGGLISGLFLRSRFGTFAGSAINGGLLGGVVTLLGVTLGGAAIFAFVAFIVTMMMSNSGGIGGIPGGGYGGFGGGSGGGSSWGGGGGGGFGGGGASGDW
jgi:uncharacterized protein